MAFAFRATGTFASNTAGTLLSPGKPAGTASGDLLVMSSAQRTATTPANNTYTLGVTGWREVALQTQQATNIGIWVRIADGGANDTQTIDWSGSDHCWATVTAYSGGTYSDLATIVAHGPGYEIDANTGQLLMGTLNIDTANCLVFQTAAKKKTITSDDGTTVTAPASFTKRQQDFAAGNRVIAYTGDWIQTTATTTDGANPSINGTPDTAGSVGICIAFKSSGTAPTLKMDRWSWDLRTGVGSPQTWTHPGAASGVKGVALCIIHNISSTDHVSAASYGGTALTRQQRNTDTATEPGAAEVWFLGTGVAQGSQTVSYTPTATTDDFFAVVFTLTGGGDLEVIATGGLSENQTDPSVALSYGGRESLAFASGHSGGIGQADGTGAMRPNAGTFRAALDGYGASAHGYALAQITAGTADFTIGGTLALDDCAFSAIAVAQVAGAPATENLMGQIVM